MIENGVHRCDFCYSPMPMWKVEFREQMNVLGWDLEICDSCRLLLRNVIGVVLHRLTHAEIVDALVTKLAQKGMIYSDLMMSMVEIKGSKQKELEDGK